jgi:hypothetical protein
VLGTVAQLIAITTHGNGLFNAERTANVADFYPSNSTFQFCESVRFVDVARSGDGHTETDWAPDPIAWFDRLKQDETQALRLHHGDRGGTMVGAHNVPDRMLAGFAGGGGRWLIEAIHPLGADYWQARWEVGDRMRADRKIWRVTYGRVSRAPVPYAFASEDLEELRRALDHTLLEIAHFASSHRLENFAAIFARSRALLSASQPGDPVYHPDLTLPGQLTPVAQRLLEASQVAWVFGGMGSWNDLGQQETEDETYQRLSESLYGLLNRAYVAVANSTAPGVMPMPQRPWWKRWPPRMH